MGHAFSSRCGCKRCSRISSNAAREERNERSAAESRSTPGRVAQAATTAFIAVAGATAQPEQASDTTQSNFERWSQTQQSNRRTDSLNEATRDQGQAAGGTNAPA